MFPSESSEPVNAFHSKRDFADGIKNLGMGELF
jgi:hypothetical protein